MRRHTTAVRKPLTVAAISLALVTGACSAAEGDPAGSGTDESSPTAEQPQDERPELARYYDQELAFGSCEGYGTTAAEKQRYVEPYECARLEVPMDYADPEGATMQVAVLRLPAEGDPTQRIGSLVLNPGGPGGSGMSQAALVGPSLAEGVTEQRLDVVGFDPRGVGSSTPAIDCFTDAERDRGEDQTTLLASTGEWTEDDTRALVARCAERSGGEEVLGAVGTRDVARDMDVLRSALGDERLTFAGQSYGTRLGAVYAEMFPDEVRAMVLDGAADPTAENPERRLTQQAGFQRSFDLMAASCAQSPDCPLGTDPARASEVFQDLVQPLIDQPVPAGDGRTLDFNRATGAVTAALYDSASWPTVIRGITEMKNGDGTLLLAISDSFAARGADGTWANYLEAILAINCNDEVRRTPQEEARLRADIVETSPFLATGQEVEGVSRDACESWPVEPSLGIPYAQDVEGLPETLVVSVTGDPATPCAAGQVLADELGGTVLTVEGEQHTVVQAATSPCVNDVVSRYLIDLEAPDPDQKCTL